MQQRNKTKDETKTDQDKDLSRREEETKMAQQIFRSEKEQQIFYSYNNIKNTSYKHILMKMYIVVLIPQLFSVILWANAETS